MGSCCWGSSFRYSQRLLQFPSVVCTHPTIIQKDHSTRTGTVVDSHKDQHKCFKKNSNAEFKHHFKLVLPCVAYLLPSRCLWYLWKMVDLVRWFTCQTWWLAVEGWSNSLADMAQELFEPLNCRRWVRPELLDVIGKWQSAKNTGDENAFNSRST
jgi:hypothetical protein